MLHWFTHVKIAHKLAVGFGMVLLLMLSTLAVDVLASEQQAAAMDHLIHHLDPAHETAHEIVTLARTADDDAAWSLLSHDPKEAAEFQHAFEQDMQHLRQTLAQAFALADTSIQRRELTTLTSFYFGVEGYYDDTESAFTQKHAGQLQAAYANFVDNPTYTSSLSAADIYITTVEDEVAQETALVNTAAQLVLWLSLSLSALATLFGVGIAFLIVRSITRPLAQVQQAAQRVSQVDVPSLARGMSALAQGDLTVPASIDTTLPSYDSRDEIGQTAQAVRMIITEIQQTIAAYEVARPELQRLYGQLAEQNQTLQSLATTDPLTGLPNHRAVMSRMEEELSRRLRTQESCAILFVDLDHFKRINDTWGHQAGDAILREVGRRLSSLIRREDCVGRYGGEEFAIVLTNTDLAEAKQSAERLRAALANTPYIWQAEEGQSVIAIPISGSIGVAVSPKHGSTREALIEAADTAMYYAKHTGRNRVCLADEAIAVVEEVVAKAGDGKMIDAVAVKSLTSVANLPDRQMSANARRMQHLAEATARQLGRPDEELQLIRLAALLHDIGKLGIPDTILHKPGPLTEEEWAVMCRYPEIGRQILVQAGGIFVLLSRIVVAQHERWDGGGYPYGLAGEAIPLGARILAVVDAYDAMFSERPYRKAMSADEARAELERCAGSQFDPQVVAAFLRVLDEQEGQADAVQVEEQAREETLPTGEMLPQSSPR